MTSSINIFFSIPPFPNLSFLHLSFFELSHPTFNLSSFHNLSYPISSFLLSDSASTHLQLPSSLTSNSLLIPTTHPNPHFLSQHNQSSPTSTQVPSPLHFHVFLSINHPMRLPVTLFLSFPPTQHLHLSLTSHPPLLPFQFSLHLLRHRLSGSFSNLHAEIHRAGCLWHARGTTIPRRSAVKTMPRDNRDHYAASSTSTRNYHSYLNPSYPRLVPGCCCCSSKYPQRVIVGGTWTSSNGVNGSREKQPPGGGKCEGRWDVMRILWSKANTSTFRGISSEDGDVGHNWYFRDIVQSLC